jgi:hypothetical protein
MNSAAERFGDNLIACGSIRDYRVLETKYMDYFVWGNRSSKLPVYRIEEALMWTREDYPLHLADPKVDPLIHRYLENKLKETL